MEFHWKDLPLMAAETFDLPTDVVAALPALEVLGDRELLMDRHQGILSYSREVIDINGGRLIVRIRGEELELLAMTDQTLRVRGRITAIEMIR